MMALAWSGTGARAQSSTEVTLETEDGKNVRGSLRAPDVAEGQRSPAVVLIHQAGSDRSEWDGLVEMLDSKGYVTLAYDVRGHGTSDPIRGGISSLFNDPDLAPLDLNAALDFLRNLDSVDPERVAVVGASVGANLAAMSTYRFDVKTAVAISAKESAVFALGGTVGGHLQSVFYIASELEQGGARAGWAYSLSQLTEAPTRVRIVNGSRSHGVSVFADDVTVMSEIVSWLEETL